MLRFLYLPPKEVQSTPRKYIYYFLIMLASSLLKLGRASFLQSRALPSFSREGTYKIKYFFLFRAKHPPSFVPLSCEAGHGSRWVLRTEEILFNNTFFKIQIELKKPSSMRITQWLQSKRNLK